MGIRLKSKIKSYINNVWLIEIIVLLLIVGYFGIETYKNFSSKSYSRVMSAVEATINPKDYYTSSLDVDISKYINMIYLKTNCLELLDYGTAEVKDNIRKNFLYKSYETNIDLGKRKIYFIIKNKKTDEIYTNDPNQYFQVDDVEYTTENIKNYIVERYNSEEIYAYYDNKNSFNRLVENGNFSIDNEIIGDFEEYYYTGINTYSTSENIRIVYDLIFLAIVAVFLFIKILRSIIKYKENFRIRGNYIMSIIYVFKYGFRYKQPRRALIGSIIGFIIFFIVYLYLLAIGGYENNMLVGFFRAYPFKGSLLLIILPMVGVVYSIKKTIEISMVSDSLKKINEGDINYHIAEKGGPEILDLIENINKIRRGYEIAVQDTLKNEKLKTELISNVSHDLRTPLTSIINYVNILKSPEITEEERTEYLKIVEQKSKKLKILIDDLFEMSKINSGKMKISKEKINILALIHQVVGEYSYLYEEKNIEFKVNSLSDEIYMDLDGKLMSRVIENVIINAMKYSLDNTRVYIDIIDREDEVEISFKNIANYEMNFDNNEIFERFVRGDESRNSKVEGSGLGLAITKSIIELHDGSINIVRDGDMFKMFVILPKTL